MQWQDSCQLSSTDFVFLANEHQWQASTDKKVLMAVQQAAVPGYGGSGAEVCAQLSSSPLSKDLCQALLSDPFTLCTCMDMSCYWSTNCPSKTQQSSPSAQPHTSEAMSQRPCVTCFAQFSDLHLGNPKGSGMHLM